MKHSRTLFAITISALLVPALASPVAADQPKPTYPDAEPIVITEQQLKGLMQRKVTA